MSLIRPSISEPTTVFWFSEQMLTATTTVFMVKLQRSLVLKWARQDLMGGHMGCPYTKKDLKDPRPKTIAKVQTSRSTQEKPEFS